MCCNGWRASFAWASINGDLHRVASWRPVTFADPRFSWESEPKRVPCPDYDPADIAAHPGDEYPRSVRVPLRTVAERFARGGSYADSMMAETARDWSTEQRLHRLRADTVDSIPWLGVRP